MIICKLELFYICVAKALLSRSDCQNFYTTEAPGGRGCWLGILWWRWGSLESGVRKGCQAAGVHSRWRKVLWLSGYLSYAFTTFKTKFTVVEAQTVPKLRSDNSKNENKSQADKTWLK